MFRLKAYAAIVEPKNDLLKFMHIHAQEAEILSAMFQTLGLCICTNCPWLTPWPAQRSSLRSALIF